MFMEFFLNDRNERLSWINFLDLRKFVKKKLIKRWKMGENWREKELIFI